MEVSLVNVNPLFFNVFSNILGFSKSEILIVHSMMSPQKFLNLMITKALFVKISIPVKKEK